MLLCLIINHLKQKPMIDLTHLHPMVVHFPIALLIVGFATDVAGLFIKREFLNQAGFYLLILGALGTMAALSSGELAGEGIAEYGELGLAIERHEEAAELAGWLVGIAAAARIALVLLKKHTGLLKIAALVLFFAAVLAIARTGYYGGKLVYENAAGVQLNMGSDFNTTFGTGDDDDDDD